MTDLKKLTGLVVPLGALYTKENPVIGEFEDLIPFAAFCKKSGIKLIQLLPVNDTGTQSSPYSGLSAFALHPIYIRLKSIKEFDDLYKNDGKFKNDYDCFVKANQYKARYDYDGILNSKNYFLRQIYNQTETFKNKSADSKLEAWIKKNEWVKSYAVYKNLKWKYMQAGWKNWEKADQTKSAEEIEALWNDKNLKADHLFYAWMQQVCDEQFTGAVEAVHKEGILLKGDMPILMNEDSCDAWSLPQYFNQDLRAGSPSDGENPLGQNWGFPTYNWKNLKTDNYLWWIKRLKNAEKYYDAYRLDHILGFFRIWAIPSEDTNALNGHTEPYAYIKRDELYEMGFDDNRIRWLSQSHIPTGIVEDITWNHDAAHKILELLCDRIGNEELWLFKKSVKGSRQIADAEFGDLCTEDAGKRIKEKLVEYWSNRTLIEIGKNKFVPMWTYDHSVSWASLNETEKSELKELFEALDKKNEKLWSKQADEIFTAITKDIKMIPCGEDLGVGIKCVPVVMKKHNILGLRVVRWSRYWDKPEQPYVEFENYTPLSVCTTSVHDSSTIRQWWIDENEEEDFTPEIAEKILKDCSKSASVWYVPPLQDFLYMDKEYWKENPEDERINVPGSVNKFNWTYRIPCSVEDLQKNEKLIKKIASISR